jgi:septum formation protein
MPYIEPRIYLASRSPRRRELLHQIHVNFEVLLFRNPTRGEEEVSEAVLPGEDAETYVQRVTLAKAEAGVLRVHQRHLRPYPVLAADTTVELNGVILGKPADDADAAAMLARLSGRTHRVLTAVAVADENHWEHRLSVSEVRFRALDPGEIRRYVLTGEPRDKAGAYGIQGRAAMFIEEIHGSYTGIMGLPLFETAQLLKQFGYPL